MRCIRCGTEMVPGILEYHIRWNKEKGLFMFKDIPVEECPNCEEVYFSADVLEEMEKVIEHQVQPQEELKVPVYALENSKV